MPPLLQDIAPLHPFDANIKYHQSRRNIWRHAWPPYVTSIEEIIEHLIAKESREEYILAYRNLVVSIKDDVQDVMASNPDIRAIDWVPRRYPRTSHSYLAYSETLLRESLTQLEEYLGDGENDLWKLTKGSPVRKFGENYPADDFREVLHYGPHEELPTWFQSWFTVLSGLQLLFFLFFFGGLLVSGVILFRFLAPFVGHWLKSVFDYFYSVFHTIGASSQGIFSGAGSAWSTFTKATTEAVTGSAPTSTGSPFAAVGGDGPLEFKVSGTMKILRAA